MGLARRGNQGVSFRIGLQKYVTAAVHTAVSKGQEKWGIIHLDLPYSAVTDTEIQ